MKTYRLGCKCRASAIVPLESAFSFEIKDPPAAKFTFQTAAIPFGDGQKLPGDLNVIAEGEATSIQDAEKFANGAAFLTKVVAVGANAYCARLEPELIVETTPGVDKRDYFQRLVPSGPPVMTARFIDAEAMIMLLQAVLGHPDREIIGLAINQYDLALSYWGLREELLVVCHLYMCAETLKIPMLKKVLATENISEHELAERWGWEQGKKKKFLQWQCREREIFCGDEEVSKSAAEISNTFEHGYENWHQFYPKACEIVEPLARYLREAIFRLVSVKDEALKVLQSDRYKFPLGPQPIEFRIEGSILGKADSLETGGKHLPRLGWNQTIDAIEAEEERFTFTTSSHLTAHLPDGLEFSPLNLTVSAPEGFNFKINDAANAAETTAGEKPDPAE